MTGISTFTENAIQSELKSLRCQFCPHFGSAASRDPGSLFPSTFGVQSICRKVFIIKKFLYYYTTTMCLSNSIPNSIQISEQEIISFHKRNKKSPLFFLSPPKFQQKFTPKSYKWNNTQLHKINQYTFILKVQELSRRFPALGLDEFDEFELVPGVPSPR